MGWTVPREWPGETCFILGGGPSLSNFDAAVLRGEGRRVIVVNRSFRMAPWADVLYFCDRIWWTNVDGAEVKQKFTGKYIVSISEVPDPIVKTLNNAQRTGLALDPTDLAHGSNSGYQAINLAYHFGVKRIVLLGFDMQITEPDRMTGLGAVTHHHGGYGAPMEIVRHVLKARMLPHFANLVEPLALAGVDVLNANPHSALECWPRVTIESILESESYMRAV